MKTLFKITFLVNIFGWIPLILVGAVHAKFNSLAGYSLLASIVCLSWSILSFSMLMQYKSFWKSVKQLEETDQKLSEEIIQWKEAKETLIRKSLKLVDKILELDKS